MSAETQAADGTIDAAADVAELEDRDIRALLETMTVLGERAPEPADADGLFHVTTASGSSYVVEPELGACDCPDAEHRDPEGGCKHVRRVRFEIGSRHLPADVNADAIDDQFRQFVSEHTNE